SIPETAELLTAVEFTDAVEGIARHGPYARKLREDLWSDVERSLDTRELGRLLGQIDKALEFVTSAEKWRLHAVNAGNAGGADTEPSRAVIDMVNRARQLAAQGSNLILKHGPRIAEDHCNERGLEVIDRILQHLADGGRLGAVTLALNPQWKALKRASRVDDAAPSAPPARGASGSRVCLRAAPRNARCAWARCAASWWRAGSGR